VTINRRILNIVASFVIMLCIGGVYAWSVFASELVSGFRFTVSQTQLVFGFIIAVFPVTMIFVNKLKSAVKLRYMGYICGVLFCVGYYIASISQGNFIWILFGIGLIVGISTGFGYWLTLNLAVISFPRRRGLVTGIVTAGFGVGALVMTEVSEALLVSGYSVLDIFGRFSIVYGLLIIVFSSFISCPHTTRDCTHNSNTLRGFVREATFFKLVSGMLLGTISGLFIIGSLKMIGAQKGIGIGYLNHAVSVFALSNFLGRLFWGAISDYNGSSISIFLALLMQAIGIVALNLSHVSHHGFIIITSIIGIAFGGNFVLFAKETANAYGASNVGLVYPYVYLGYAAAGIGGPLIGGMLADKSGSFFSSIMIAGSLSLAGSVMFLWQYINERNALQLA